MELSEFKKLVIPFSPHLLAFAARILGDSENARDVVQDVFLKLWLMKDELNKYRSMEALAMTMTKNLCIDQLRKLKPLQWNDSLDVSDAPANDETESRIIFRETGARVIQILETLPEQQRMVIHLKDIEGYSTEEVMEIMGINANTLRVNLSRARKKVREVLTQKTGKTWIAEQ